MIKLSSIVEEYMREEERLDSAYYDLYLDYASTGLRDMSYDVSGVGLTTLVNELLAWL